MNIETMSPEAILEQWDNQYEQRHYFSNKSREINFLIEEADNVFNALSTLTEAGIVVSINEEDKVKLKDIIHNTIENIKQWFRQIKERFVEFINKHKERSNEDRIKRLKEKIKKCEEKQKKLKSNNSAKSAETSAKGESAILYEADDENGATEEDGNVIFKVVNPIYIKVSNDLEKICGPSSINDLMNQMQGDPDAFMEKVNKAIEDLKNYKANFKLETAGEVSKDDISLDDIDDNIDANMLYSAVDTFALTNKLLSTDIAKFNADIDLYNQTIDYAEKQIKTASNMASDDAVAEILKIANGALKLDKDTVSFLTSIAAEETKILNKNAKGIAYLERQIDKFLAA